MPKVVLTDISSGYDLSKINYNFTELARVLNDLVLFRNAPIGEPNTLEQDVDLNGKRLYNAPSPVNDGDLVTKRWVDDNINPATNDAAIAAANSAAAALLSEQNAASSASSSSTSASNALTSETNASTSASNASSSEMAAAASAAQAAIYSSLGLGGASAFDFGSVTDLIVVFPTDFGTIV